MAKCGKGCMPECEYFTTGGCISPLSCPYKIETGYINSATSTTDSHTGLLMEFDEMGFCPTTVCPNPEQTAIEWKEQIVKEIQKLQAENAELRAKLETAVELPCKLGDTLIIKVDKPPEGYVPRFYCTVDDKEIDITEYVHEENFSTEE